MAEGPDPLAEARRASDPAHADRLAVRALAAAPDRAETYAFRGELAVRRGDAVSAAHHFRAAYARGDRTPLVRVGLSMCLAAAGQAELATRVREGDATPRVLEDFDETVRAQSSGVRMVLAGPLPPRGAPALLPGERLPPDAAWSAPSAPPDPPTTRPVDDGAVLSRPTSSPTPPAQAAEALASGPRTRRLGGPAPEWLEPTSSSPLSAPDTGGAPDWLLSTGAHADELNQARGASGPSLTVERVELVVDPGVPEVAIRSPVTGRLVSPDEMARQRQGAQMPELVLEDPLEAEGLFRGTLASGVAVRVAVFLPGPVTTAPGQAPRTLCKRVALGVTRAEILLRDPDRGPEATVRLPVSGVRRLDVVGDGQQLSLLLADGRQIHLDLRALKRRTPRMANAVIDALADALEAPA